MQLKSSAATARHSARRHTAAPLPGPRASDRSAPERRIAAHRPFIRRSVVPGILAAAAFGLLGSTGVAHAEGVSSGQRAHPGAHPAMLACDNGEFCTWDSEFYRGELVTFDLRNTNPEECVPLPEGVDARSFASRTERHVSVYQDRNCATEGDFTTYPGPGTYVPQAPFVVRAIQLWN